MHAGYTDRIANYVKRHQVSLGLFLASYGVFYLSSVLLSLWTVADWGKDISGSPTLSANTLLPRSFISPIFFVTSIPALVIGTAFLCSYTVRGMKLKTDENREYISILLTVFGFAYQVIGAWPLQNAADFPWQWQKQIVNNGTIFAWALYILSLIVLVVGVISLYEHSRIYRKEHIELSKI